ncbi:ceramide glucosyltransferase, partial [Lecanoromycetidae sp. Uapishka_2]
MISDYTAICCLGGRRRNHLKTPVKTTSSNLPLACVPHVTIIRPIKGIEPHLYECLAATFEQAYPQEKLTIYFCISSRDDPALKVLEYLLSDFPTFDAKILVENEDPNLSGRNGSTSNLGPNPKIRNMSRAYREAKGDIVWIIDCNIWVAPPVAGRMVDLLCGFTPTAPDRKYKFVHQLPLVVDVSSPDFSSASILFPKPDNPSIASMVGGLTEELFLSTSHAKFYTAIATVAIAPCTVGKSNMFRKSHLDALTSTPSASKSNTKDREPGIDYFSDNICEDHLIGDLLWKSPIPNFVQKLAATEGKDPNDSTHFATKAARQISWGNHALLPPHPSNLATQPTSHLSLSSYWDRRTRWLRVRKFTVTLATLVEPGTESLLCSLVGAYGLTTLPWCEHALAQRHYNRTPGLRSDVFY